jgi:hypothetical protein
MIKIDLITVGDEWVNKEEVDAKLSTVLLDQEILFSTRHEGISLIACGFIDYINHWVKQNNKNPSLITVDTPNYVEQIPYKLFSIRNLHFLSKNKVTYHVPQVPIDPDSKLFGLFVGRYTADRNSIVRDMLAKHEHCVLSVMHNDQTDLNNPCTVTYDQDIWDIGSIDNMAIGDQYKDKTNTNQSLLGYYNQFQIEIVAETITRGTTFFPTEKTVRTIMGSKPMLVFGPMNHLKYLRGLGFKTFGDLWSEEYDNYEGQQRWHQIKQIIDKIIDKNYDCNVAQDIVKYNYQHLQKILNGQTKHQQ